MGKESLNIGREGEERAVEYLQSLGYEIVARNFHSRFGEIDIIAQKDGVVHFIEVKASMSKNPLENITSYKMQKLKKTIRYYLYTAKIEQPYQIDALIIQNNQIELLENISI